MNERTDISRVIQWFADRGIDATPFPVSTGQKQKSPDLILNVDDQRIGFCEVKSINPFGISIDHGVDRQKIRLANALVRGVKQLSAADPTRSLAWAMAFVNHDETAEHDDFIALMHGEEVIGDDMLIYDERNHPNQIVSRSRRLIDIALWFGDVQPIVVWSKTPSRIRLTAAIGNPYAAIAT